MADIQRGNSLSKFIGNFIEKIEEIEINESYIRNAQKEMEIITKYVLDITKTIWLTRNFLIVTLTGLITYVLLYKGDPGLLFVAIILILFVALMELVQLTWQINHLNRLWQLDRAINKIIIKESMQGNTREIFKRKHVKSKSISDLPSLLFHAFISPTFFITYFGLFLAVLFFFIIKFNWCRCSMIWILVTIIILIIYRYTYNKYRKICESYDKIDSKESPPSSIKA